ncbi:helix-turn-helix transcriptional regulator [Streptomyces avidinii]|uniref:helix-turn-helix transcriptional regulator n=1 Tax=Streptomyces avidinii TaxID=1895 RepID=UPI003864C8F5|nr:helix-turn-helix transcriptional regulator [Streptomyces avidinii]
MTTVAPGSDVRRHELADFLRTRRELITPDQVGLVSGPRRRTPGLRREEVAHLSSVGVTWYTWLEQARDIQVSAQVLDSVARALLLDVSEREHLFALAGSLDPAPPADCPSVTPAVRAMLDQLGPIPACVQNSRYDAVAYNATYGRLLCDLDSKPPEDRNCMWLAFTDPEWREAVVDLPSTHRIMAARFRAAMAEHLAEPAWTTLLARLEGASAEFREVWARHEVVGGQVSKAKYIRNAHVGMLHVEHTNLWLGPRTGPRVVTYVPLDEETRERLEALAELAGAGVPVTA